MHLAGWLAGWLAGLLRAGDTIQWLHTVYELMLHDITRHRMTPHDLTWHRVTSHAITCHRTPHDIA